MKALDLIKLPNWHNKNDKIIDKSLKQSCEIAPHLKNLANNLIINMPRMVRASQNLKSISIEKSSHLFRLDNAISLPWISFNTDKAINCLLLDIDHDEGLAMWEDLPDNIKPHLVIDPWSGRSLAIIQLATPVLTGEGARLGPQFLANLAHEMMASYFEATALPHSNVVKNPWGLSSNIIGTLSRRSQQPSTGILWDTHQQINPELCWHTVPGKYEIELRDIIDVFKSYYENYAPKSTKRKFINRGEPSSLGKNCLIFDLLRFWCYDHNESSFQAIYQKCIDLDFQENTNLPKSDIKSISKSISKFMNTRFNPRTNLDSRRGIMGLKGSPLNKEERQRVSARRTHSIQNDRRDAKIKWGLENFPKDKKLSQRVFSKISGLSLKTVERNWENIKNMAG
ncbi:replication initiation protein [Acetobacter thailandicus]|uniref:Replication initiation protein n=1 Tax=Acetobacter thailandicus TaxID=1502842 RepID=A0ABT3QEL2_9PROT|nr:replication initiation protein [Acetobacter thailandicus]MCX2563699.1 replication initiation protein [Acetobacter thailandicus]